MRLQRTTTAIATCLAAMLVLAGCSSSNSEENSSSSGSPGLTKFTSAVFQSELYLSDFVAKDEGFFVDHGLDVSFVTPSSGSAAAQLMLAGQVQGWFTDVMIVLTAAAKGQDIKVAGIAIPAMTMWLLVSKSSDLPPNDASFNEKMAALKGKTIGVSGIGAGTDHVLLAGLNAAGVPFDSVPRVGIGQQQAAIGQLEAGSIAGYMSFSLAGNKVIEQQTGARLYVDFGAKSVPGSVRTLPGLTGAVQGSYAKQHPKTVANWLAAEQEAWKWIKENPDKAAAVLNKHVYNGEKLEFAKGVVEEFVKGPLSSQVAGMKFPKPTFTNTLKTMKALKIIPDTNLAYDDAVIPSARTSK